MASKYLTEEQVEAIKRWCLTMKARYPQTCVAGYMVFNDLNDFIALDAFSAAPHRLGQGAFLVGTEIVSTVESSGEIKLLHVGFIWLAPEPSEKQKDHVKREILKMAMIDRERKVTR